jgi:hypothetical protein
MLALVALLAGLAAPAYGEGESLARLVLAKPDTSGFPTILLSFEPYDALGTFVTDLQAADVQVLEDNTALPIDSLDLLHPGVDFVLAFNVGPEMANYYAEVMRFKNLQKTMLDWAAKQSISSKDTYGFTTNTGIQISQLTSPQDWAAKVKSFQPDLYKTQSDTTALSAALDMVAGIHTDASTKKAVLLITTLPPANQTAALKDLTSRATSLNVRVFVWLVAPAAAVNTDQGKALQDLTTQTNGAFFQFTGPEKLPDPEGYLAPLRNEYRLIFHSAAGKSGDHTIQLKVERSNLSLASSNLTYSVDVAAPNPIFLQPPDHLSLQWVDQSGQDEPVLTPSTFPVKVLIEFPDKHERTLKALRVYINNKLAVEKTQPPFDSIDVPTTSITTSGQVQLRLEIEDALGFTAHSIDLPLDVKVGPKPYHFFKELFKVVPWQAVVITLAVLAAGGVLAFFLLRGSKRTPWAREEEEKRREFLDPVTQPVLIQQESLRKPVPAGMERPSWPRTESGSAAPARLVRLEEGNLKPIPGSAIPILRREVTFGSDARLASSVLDSPSVQGLHARLYQDDQGGYYLADAGSIAGTWVNYTPISTKGVHLEHGDLIHFGRVIFRFELAHPPMEQLPKVEIQ